MTKSIENAKSIRKKATESKLENITFAFSSDNNNDPLQFNMNELIVGVINLKREADKQIGVAQLQHDLAFHKEVANKNESWDKTIQDEKNIQLQIENTIREKQALLTKTNDDITYEEDVKQTLTDQRLIEITTGRIATIKNKADKLT